jgi:hypothetical protein
MYETKLYSNYNFGLIKRALRYAAKSKTQFGIVG